MVAGPQAGKQRWRVRACYEVQSFDNSIFGPRYFLILYDWVCSHSEE